MGKALVILKAYQVEFQNEDLSFLFNIFYGAIRMLRDLWGENEGFTIVFQVKIKISLTLILYVSMCMPL